MYKSTIDCTRGRKLKSIIDSRGRITLPLELRNRLGLRPGDSLFFIVQDGGAAILTERVSQNPFLKYIGRLPNFKSTVQVNAWVRSLRDERTDKEK